MHGLALASLRHRVPRVLGIGGRALGLVAEEPGALDRVIAAALRVGQLDLQSRTVGRGLGDALAERGELPLDRHPLTLEGAQALRLLLQLLLSAANLVPLLRQAAAHLLLGAGPAQRARL